MPIRNTLLLLAILVARSFGAISYDNSASANGYSTSPVSWNHTVGGLAHTGTLVYITTQPGSTDIVVGVTVGSSSMTRVKYCPYAGSYQTVYAYWLANAPSGTQSITVSWSAQYWATSEVSISYSGVTENTPLNASCNTANDVGPTVNFPQPITTVANNSLVVGYVEAQGYGVLAGSGTALHAGSGNGAGENLNGPVSPAGPATLNCYQLGTTNIAGIVLELEQYATPAAAGRVFIL